MRLAQISCVVPPYGGGIGRVAAAYAKLLSREHQVTLFTPRYSGRDNLFSINGVKIRQLPTVVKYGNAALWPQLNRELKDFDIIHLHYPFFGVQEWLSVTPKQKLVVSYHMIPQAGGLKGWWFKIDSQFSERRLVTLAKVWIVSSADFATAVVKPRLGEKARIEVLPFGADERFHTGTKSLALMKRYSLSSDIPTILFVGGLDKAHAFKGVEVLLGAVSALKQYQFKLMIVGGGELLPHYQKLAQPLGISSRVVFTGRVSDEELAEIYRSADIFVLPSVNSAETFGLVVLEAMASGLPVVASNLPGVRSLVRDNETGLLCQPGDEDSLIKALATMLNNLGAARRWGSSAGKIVNQHYRWPAIGRKLQELYQNL